MRWHHLLLVLLMARGVCAQERDPVVEAIELGIDTPQPTAEELDAIERRSWRMGEMAGMFHRRRSHPGKFAMSIARELDLSEEQEKDLRRMSTVQPLYLAEKLGFKGIKDDADAWYLQPEKEWQANFKKLSDLNWQEQKREQAYVDDVLDDRQQQLLRELHFEYLMTQDYSPVRALVAIGIKPERDQCRRISRVMKSSIGATETQRLELLKFMIDTWGKARLRFAARLPESGIVRDETPVPVYFFGGRHDRLEQVSPPNPGTRCELCQEKILPNDSGYIFSGRPSHEHCFVSGVLRMGNDRVKSNPRR